MSDAVETKAEEVKPQPLELNGQPVVVERNGVSKLYKLFKIIKGKERKGAQYPCPDITEESKFDETVTWFGKKNVLNVLQNFVKQNHQRLRWDCTGDDGVFNLNRFLSEAKDFDVAGLTLQQISDKIDELQAIQGKRVIEATVEQYADPAWQEETKRIATEIRDYMARWDERKGKKAQEEPEASVVA